MGRIFTPLQVVENKVNTTSDVYDAKNQTYKLLEDLRRSEMVIGAHFFGSIATETANRRSDIDVLVLTIPEVEDIVCSLLEQLEDRINVPIETGLIFSNLRARRGVHTVESGLYRHIEQSPSKGNIIGEDPLNAIHIPHKHPLNDWATYLSNKLRSYSDRSKPDWKRAQRALEAPANMGRRYIDYLVADQQIQRPINDQKSTIIKLLCDENILTPDLKPLFLSLVQMNKDYDEQLTRALEGNTDDYVALYEKLIRLAPKYAYQFANGLASELCFSIEGGRPRSTERR